MKKIKTFLVILFILCLSSVAFAFKATWNGKVVSVHDGDTITIERSGLIYKIRLYGVDCPELMQSEGYAAQKFAEDLVKDKDVVVDVKALDRYGRYVGIVYVEGMSLNEELLVNGLAWEYPTYCKLKAICHKYRELEFYAKKNKLGLWGKSEDPVPPWMYRKHK